MPAQPKEMAMTTYRFATEIPRAASRPALTTRVAETVANFYRAWKNRRAFYRLGEMSDAELADIGLTRSDLHVAIDVPFGRDPTVRLRCMAEDRAETIEDIVRRAV
jgi:uncharacterized protein YjiS (DUF1127 family)